MSVGLSDCLTVGPNREDYVPLQSDGPTVRRSDDS